MSSVSFLHQIIKGEGDLGKNTKFALGVRSLGQIYHSGGRLVDPKK